MPASDTQQASIVWKPRVPAEFELSAKAIPKGVPPLIWEVLRARGFHSEADVQKWLSPSLKYLRDPYSLPDMHKAVARILEAIEKKQRICVYADYDLDGTSALALLLKAFDFFDYQNLTYYQPKRLSEGYGLHKDAISKLHQDGVNLIVTVDLGITAIDEVAFASELGLETIVTDHHLPKETLPQAFAVVNPNRGDCASDLGHLCGTGVAFYLVLALRRALLEQGLLKKDFDPKELLDCFVIGTLTDMVPLIDENRVLVKHGLLALAQTKRPGLRALLQALNMWGNPLTSQDVAIRFAPKLNALSRMEMGIQPIDIYLAKDDATAQSLIDQVLANNQDRMSTQKSAEEEALAYLKQNPPQHAIFIWSRNFHRGVVGLVATKLSQEFKLPTFVGSLGESGQIVGSARMPDGFPCNLLEAMEAATAHLLQFGGHAVAAGFELKAEQALNFRTALETYFAEKLVQREPRFWLYDAESTLTDLNPDFMTWYEHLSPFGAQFAAPVFMLHNIMISQVKVLKGDHLRLTFSESALQSRAAIWFAPPKSHGLLSGKGLQLGLHVDALVEPQWNYFNGRRTLQLLVQDLRFAQKN